MSRFEQVEVFLTVCEAGSFTAAADRLGLSRSRVSQLVAGLEQRLGVTLLHRTTRSLSLTQEAELFRSQCRDGLQLLEAAEHHLMVRAKQLSGSVRVNSVGGLLGEYYVAQVLAEVVSQHSELELDLTFSSQRVDMNNDPYDLAIRVGDEPGSGVEAVQLGEIENILCASPKYLNASGFPRHPKELVNYNCLTGTPRTWVFFRGEEICQQSVQGNWHSPSSQALLLAVEHGIGIARLSNLVVGDAIAEGRLLRILDDWRVGSSKVWLVSAQHTEPSTRVRVVRDHLIRRFRTFNLAVL